MSSAGGSVAVSDRRKSSKVMLVLRAAMSGCHDTSLAPAAVTEPFADSWSGACRIVRASARLIRALSSSFICSFASPFNPGLSGITDDFQAGNLKIGIRLSLGFLLFVVGEFCFFGCGAVQDMAVHR